MRLRAFAALLWPVLLILAAGSAQSQGCAPDVSGCVECIAPMPGGFCTLQVPNPCPDGTCPFGTKLLDVPYRAQTPPLHCNQEGGCFGTCECNPFCGHASLAMVMNYLASPASPDHSLTTADARWEAVLLPTMHAAASGFAFDRAVCDSLLVGPSYSPAGRTEMFASPTVRSVFPENGAQLDGYAWIWLPRPADLRSVLRRFIDEGTPVVLNYLFPYGTFGGHSVVLVGYREDPLVFYTLDPLCGPSLVERTLDQIAAALSLTVAIEYPSQMPLTSVSWLTPLQVVHSVIAARRMTDAGPSDMEDFQCWPFAPRPGRTYRLNLTPLDGGNVDLYVGSITGTTRLEHEISSTEPGADVLDFAAGWSPESRVICVAGEGPADENYSLSIEDLGPCPFNDVCHDHWAAEPVQALKDLQIVDGIGNGDFGPTLSVSRGELAKMVFGGSGLPSNTAGGPHYADVPPGHEFYTSIETLTNAGCVRGVGGRFHPNIPVRRDEAVKIVVSAFELPAAGDAASDFTDVQPDDEFFTFIELAANTVVRASARSSSEPLVRGWPDGSFRPALPLQRDQAAKLVYLAMAARAGAQR